MILQYSKEWKMKIKDLRLVVSSCKNETELSKKWMDSILRQYYGEKLDNVRYERNVIAGRFDCCLSYKNKPRCIIELKAPSVEDLENHFLQAYKYAHAMYVWREGVLTPVLGVLSNGKKAILFDSSISDISICQSSAIRLDFSSDLDYQKFLNQLSAISKGEFGNLLQLKEIKNQKQMVGSADESLYKKLYSWYQRIEKSVQDKEKSLEMVLQLYLIAISRDCGFIPTQKIKEYEENKNWKGIVAELVKIFSADFNDFNIRNTSIAWELYNETRTLPVRLDYFPADCLGVVYEKLIRAIRGKKDVKTSFFTPLEQINEVISELKITKKDKVLDPTCGASSFLVSCIRHLFPDPEKNDPKELKNYITKNIHGIDVDNYACHISKASILATYATSLPHDPIQMLPMIELKGFDIPEINIHNSNFFHFETDERYDVVLGNPPWGSIDSDKVLDPKIKPSLTSFRSYKDKSDVCIYVYEKAFNLLRAKGRIGMLCKLQVMEGSQHKKFHEWWNGRIYKIIDYGDIQLFNNSAQTCIIFGKNSKISSTSPKIVRRGEPTGSIEFKGKKIKDLFHLTQGWMSGADDVYTSFASKHPSNPSVKNYICNKKTPFFVADKESFKKITVCIKDNYNSVFKKWVDNNPKIKKRLFSRKGCSYQYGWKRTFQLEKFDFSGKQARLIVPRVWSSQRVPVVVDLNGSIYSTTSQTVLIPKEKTNNEMLLFTSAWISSKYFHNYARGNDRCKRMGNGGIALYPDYLGKCSLPVASNFSKIVSEINKIMQKGKATPNDLEKIDTMIYDALIELGAKMKNATKEEIAA